MKPIKSFIIDIDQHGIVTLDINTLFELIETVSMSTDDEIESLKESLFDVFTNTTGRKGLS